MGLPNIGPVELIIILAIALLVVGPGRLPEMGSAIGRTIREFRKASSDMSDAVSTESKGSSSPQPNQLTSQAVPNAASAPAPASAIIDAEPVPPPPASVPEPAAAEETAAIEQQAGTAERA